MDVKNQVSYKSHQLIQFIEHLKAVVDEQGQEVKRAVIGWGKYCFKEIIFQPTDFQAEMDIMPHCYIQQSTNLLSTSRLLPSCTKSCTGGTREQG